MADDQRTQDVGARITDEGIERMRARIGVEVPKEQPWNEYATVDAIRHFAWSYGDDNPLYSSPEYAANTRWKGVIAPPTFVHTTGVSVVKEIPPEVREKGKGALAGVNALFAGNVLECFQPVRADDRLIERRVLHSVDVKKSRFSGGISVHNIDRQVYLNEQGQVTTVWFKRFIRTERQRASEKTGKRTVERAVYTQEQLREFDEAYASETRRGAEPRYWEDVKVGDAMQAMLKGPLTLSDVVAWMQGSGRAEILPSRLGWKNRQRHPKFYTLNDFGVPEAAMRCHWDDSWARKIGSPYAFDMGNMRTAWHCQLVSDWMGDDGWMWRLETQIRAFSYIGDTHWLGGTVTRKYVDGERRCVELDIWARNQRDEVTSPGKAIVILPSRRHGPATLPAAPPELEERRPNDG